MNPYRKFVADFAQLIADGKSLPLGDIPPHSHKRSDGRGPVVLMFTPHPDDECVIGALALRLLREGEKRVINVPVTLGSRKDRRAARLQEVQRACEWLGFELELPVPEGLDHVNPKCRAHDAAHWAASVKIIADVLAKHHPQIIFFPHEHDWNSTHVGTHFLVMDALKLQSRTFQTVTVETEFWGHMASPNLMVESGAGDVADLLAALSFHVGEVQRNPYHLRLPAWLQDNVRRGAELVGGQGGAAPDFLFATLYHVRRWKDGGSEEILTGGRQVGANEKLPEFPA